MDEQILTNLAQSLAADEETGFQQFRELFFEALERRRLAECQALLTVLCATSSVRLQRDCLYHQAVLHFELRQFDQAEVVLRRLLVDDLSPAQRARTLLELAIQLDLQGQWAEAEHFYREALATYEAQGDTSGQAKTYNNLGDAIRFQVEQGESNPERLTEALSCHQVALSLAQTVNDRWELSRSWYGLGMVYGLLKQYSLALAAFQEDLTLLQTLDDPCDRAISLSDMAALVYLPQGQWVEAAAALEEAIAIFRDCDDLLHLTEALTRRGHLLAHQNQLEAALSNYDEALALAESIRARLTAPTAQAGYRATAEFIYTAPLSLHLRQGAAARAFSAAERARSRVLADLLAGATAQAHTALPPELLAKRADLRLKLDQVYSEAEPAADRPQLEQALADLERQIELLDPTYASLEQVAALTAEEVSQRLPPAAVVLAYVGDAADQLWSLVVSADGVRAELVKNLSVRWLRNYLTEHLAGVWRGNLTAADVALPHLFPALYQYLIAPVWDTLQAAQTVYIVPFGPLHYLPLGALTPDLNDPPPLLAAGRRVVYTPSATILLNYCHRRQPSPQQGLLAVAPPDERLQFTLDAAKTLAQPPGNAALLGPAATRQAFLTEAGRYRVVCFLGHAFFEQRYPMAASRLKLADGSLHAAEILRELRLQADLVILSACETGRTQVLRGDELLGLSRAMLYAGTPSLLVTLWPVHEIPTRLLVEKLVEQLLPRPLPRPQRFLKPLRSRPLRSDFDPALALAATQCWLRDLSYQEAHTLLTGWGELSATVIEANLTALWQMSHPAETPQAESHLFAHPFFWSPYILIGDQRQM